MQHLQPNTTLQGRKYRIERALGQGGFGITYLAKRKSNGSKVAIKELFMGKGRMMINTRSGNMVTVISSEYRNFFNQQLEKFRKEANRLTMLHHPNLVKVSDYFEENGTAYYVMPYIEGETLLAKQSHEGQLPETLVLNYLNQLVSALKEAHKHSIWHLDIKPANIMVDRNDHIYLIDFGASKHIERDHELTTSLAVAGTEYYCPPEQLVEDKERFDIFEIGAWTDIYALGATMYNLLTGNKPPHYLAINRKGIAAFDYPVSVSTPTKEMIAWMMKPDIKDRPQSIYELRRWLEKEEEKKDVTIVETPRRKETERLSPPQKKIDRIGTTRQETRKEPFWGNVFLFCAIFTVCFGIYKGVTADSFVINQLWIWGSVICGGFMFVLGISLTGNGK